MPTIHGATVLSNAQHVIYDNQSSRNFGITNVQPTNGLVEEIFLPNTSLITDKSRYSERTYLLGVEREPLSFSMRFFIDPHTFSERKHQELKRWLYQDTYKPFRFDTGVERSLDIWVYAIVHGESKTYHNAINDGYIDFNFATNSPYRYSPVMEDEFDFTGLNSDKMRDELTEGIRDMRRGFNLFTSRLKQLTPKSSISFIEYKDAVEDYIDELDGYLDKLDNVYNSLVETNNYTGTLVARYRTIKKEFDSLVDKLDYQSQVTANMYSRLLATRNHRLTTSGVLEPENNFITSDFIQIFPNVRYQWYSAKLGTEIIDPVVVYYNSRKEVVGSEPVMRGNAIPISPPNDIHYFRVSGRTPTHHDSFWQVTSGGKRLNHVDHSFDSYKVLTPNEMLNIIADFESIDGRLLELSRETETYILAKSDDIDETVGIYPNYVSVYNFGDRPCYPLIEIEVGKPLDIRIVNRETGEGTTITDNISGEIITLRNQTRQIETSRTKIVPNYFKYDSHDDNFISLGTFENKLEIYGSCKIKFTYQFKLL